MPGTYLDRGHEDARIHEMLGNAGAIPVLSASKLHNVYEKWKNVPNRRL